MEGQNHRKGRLQRQFSRHACAHLIEPCKKGLALRYCTVSSTVLVDASSGGDGMEEDEVGRWVKRCWVMRGRGSWEARRMIVA